MRFSHNRGMYNQIKPIKKRALSVISKYNCNYLEETLIPCHSIKIWSSSSPTRQLDSNLDRPEFRDLPINRRVQLSNILYYNGSRTDELSYCSWIASSSTLCVDDIIAEKANNTLQVNIQQGNVFNRLQEGNPNHHLGRCDDDCGKAKLNVGLTV